MGHVPTPRQLADIGNDVRSDPQSTGQTMSQSTGQSASPKGRVRSNVSTVSPEMTADWQRWLNVQLERRGFASRGDDGRWRYFPSAWDKANDYLRDVLYSPLSFHAVYEFAQKGHLPSMQAAYALGTVLGIHPNTILFHAYRLTREQYAQAMGYRNGMLITKEQYKERLLSLQEFGVPEAVADAMAQPWQREWQLSEDIRRELGLSEEEFVDFAASMNAAGTKERIKREMNNDITPLPAPHPGLAASLAEIGADDVTPLPFGDDDQPGPRQPTPRSRQRKRFPNIG